MTEYIEENSISLKIMYKIFNISENYVYNEIIKLCLLLDFKLPYY